MRVLSAIFRVLPQCIYRLYAYVWKKLDRTVDSVDKIPKKGKKQYIRVWITLWRVWIFPFCQGEYSKIGA